MARTAPGGRVSPSHQARLPSDDAPRHVCANRSTGLVRAAVTTARAFACGQRERPKPWRA
ncbi:hypothetical protein HMPREF0043_00319 [Actinobaculum sp. oral taxon 183 str. F0552]|nr:hypothetical protein HMPREF0043_00319 [Actinobaculum sp. oral taxon 183 str. F0552]